MGSLFLDEVGELSIGQQAKLLTALEEGEVRRLGGEGSVRVNVRVLSATSRDLVGEMNAGRFRRELYHRLAVLVCFMPPLRERREDIPLLARRFLRALEKRHDRSIGSLSPEVIRYLEERSWPGNIREMSHLLEAALVFSEADTLSVETLLATEAMTGRGEAGAEDLPGAEDSGPKPPGPKAQGKKKARYAFLGTESEEREMILNALARARGNKTQAARELGMARNTLRLRLQRYRLQ